MLEHTTAEINSVHIAVSGLSSHQLSSKYVDLSINGCDRVRRALQYIVFRHFLPACSQRASHVSGLRRVRNDTKEMLLPEFITVSCELPQRRRRKDAEEAISLPRSAQGTTSYDRILQICNPTSKEPRSTPLLHCTACQNLSHASMLNG